MVRLKNFIFAGVMCHVSTNFVFLQLQSKLKFMDNNLFNNKYRIPSARAYWHDYNHGYFYITICTDKREHFFGEINNCKMSMTKLGLYTESYIEYLNSKHDDFKVLSHVIMPNHIHLIIAVNYLKNKHPHKQTPNNNVDVNEKMCEIAKQCGRLSSIISIFKSSVTKYAIKNDIHFGWQTRFYDRIIRDYNEFINIDNYIKNNVMNWKDDEFYPNRLHQ